MKRVAIACVFLIALAQISTTAAKDFRPGDVRLCNAKRCVSIENRSVLALLSAFYYSPGSPARARSPRLGAPAYQLRYRNGYVTGIVATTSLDRFLSYGVDLERFQRARWYRVPPRVALELRTLSEPLKPLRVTPSALSKSH